MNNLDLFLPADWRQQLATFVLERGIEATKEDASAASSEKVRDFYSTLAEHIFVNISPDDTGIPINFGIDKNYFTEEYLNENDGLFDLFEINYSKIVDTFIIDKLDDMMNSAEVQNKIEEYYYPLIENKLMSLQGGVSS